MVFEILLAIPGLVLIWILVTYAEHLISLRKYPKGPFPLPLIGNVLSLSKKPFIDFIEMSKIYGDVFSISFGMKRIVIINSYEEAQEALITRGTDFAGRPQDSIPMKIATNNFKALGILDYSKRMVFTRKLAYKSLHLYGTGMKNIEDIVIGEVDKMCSMLSKEADKPVLIHQYLGNSLVNTIFQMCFSKRYEAEEEEFLQISEAMSLINEGLGVDQAIAILPWLRFFPDTKKFRGLKKGSQFFQQYKHRVFEEHKQTLNPEKMRDVTDRLLYLSQDKQHWQDDDFQIVTQDHLESIVLAMFTAGFETSLTGLRWFLVYLIHNPDVQTKIYQEIVTNIGLKRQPVDEDKDQLPYVQASLLETNRHASFGPLLFPRKTVVDTMVGGEFVPKNTQVLINAYNIHHDPTHWNEPEKFKPERWLNADGSLKNEKAMHYLPFGAGTRVCIAEKMAKMQMFLIATRLLVNFEVSLAPGEPMPSLNDGILGLTYAPANKFKMLLKKRTN